MKAQRKRRFGQARGFSLVELLIVTAVMIVVLGMIGSLMITTQRQYMSQQALIDASNNARVGLDLMLRLARVAGNNPEDIPEDISFEPIHPDPDGNSLMDSIRLRADWNPGDGDTDDAYEDMIFSTSNGVLWIERPSDEKPVEFVDRVESLAFSYKDSNGVPIIDAVANRDSIAYVEIELRTSVPDVPMLFKSSAVIRSRK